MLELMIDVMDWIRGFSAPTKVSLCHKTAGCGEKYGCSDSRLLRLRRSALHTHNILVFKGQQGLAPSTLAAFTREFDVESPSVWRDLGKNPWELEKAKNGPSGDFMIPGELPVDAATVDVSEGFSGTIAIGQAELKDHYGLSGRCATTTQEPRMLAQLAQSSVSFMPSK